MIKLTLDTSCYDKKSKELFDELDRIKKEGLIEIWHESYSESEKDKWINPDKEKIMKLFYNFSKFKNDACSVLMEIADDPEKSFKYVEKRRGYTSKDLHKIHIRIDQITYPEGFQGKNSLNKYIDNKILSLHIVRGRDIFLTKDKMLFRKDQKFKIVEKEFPCTKIRLLNKEFIEELKTLINN